jgi:hypothetical protein
MRLNTERNYNSERRTSQFIAYTQIKHHLSYYEYINLLAEKATTTTTTTKPLG